VIAMTGGARRWQIRWLVAPLRRRGVWPRRCRAAGDSGPRRRRDAVHHLQESGRGSQGHQDRIAYTFGRDTLLLVVADGLGGHAGGEIAAQIAARLFIERFHQEAKPVIRNPLRFLQDSMERAHAALGSYADQFSMLETPRTTCVACVVQAGHAYWAHVGDSRLYLFRQGKLIGQTKDHSKVQYLVDQGVIDAEDVADHPDATRSFSCLGGVADPVIDLSRRTPLRNGDIIVLCTDGLWGVLSREEIVTWLTSTPILKTAPQMMREAEQRGGADGDNLSAIVVRWGPETLTDEPSTTITEAMVRGEFTTQMDRTLTLTDRKGAQRDLSDDEIERANEEIQATIQRIAETGTVHHRYSIRYRMASGIDHSIGAQQATSNKQQATSNKPRRWRCGRLANVARGCARPPRKAGVVWKAAPVCRSRFLIPIPDT
jgi:serine/threonine protein phosphatase PrpC